MEKLGEQETESLKHEKEYIASWIASKLRSHGFNVKRKYLVEGIGGIKHIIDIVAELSPIPGSTIRIGFLIHTKELRVDDIEKFIAWYDELPIDKIVVISLGGVDVEAYELAQKYGIDVVKPYEHFAIDVKSLRAISTYEEYYIKPKMSFKEAVEVMKSKLKPSILRRHKGRLKSVALIYVPFVVINAKLAEKNLAAGSIDILDITLAFDGVMGYPVIRSGSNIAIDEMMGSFSEISDEAIVIMRNITEHGTVFISELSGATGIPKERVKAFLDVLSDKGLVDIFGDVVEVRYDVLKKFIDPIKMAKQSGCEVLKGKPKEDEGVIVLPLKAYVSKFIELVEAINGKMESINIVYYPLFVGEIVENSKRLRFMVIDSVSGEENPAFCPIISSIEVVEVFEKQSVEVH